jgi:subtilase family serine protease
MRIVKSISPALLMAIFFSSLSYAATPDRITGALNSGETVTLRRNVHHKALPQYDQGPVDPALPLGTITLLMAPTPGQQKALKQLVAQQQDPKSPNYHKWLTPESYADRFGLSQNDTRQMAAWLKAKGFSMVQVARGRDWISFTGAAAQVQSAFGTEIHHYDVDGELHYANATAPVIPAALAGIVTGLRGLHDFRPRPMGIRRNPVARPYYNSPTFGALAAPGDIATIYDITPLQAAGIDGTGQTLAVMGQTDIYLADITDFRTGFNLSGISCTTNTSGVITACSDPNFKYVLDGKDPGLSTKGDIGEADLDVEWTGAVAPNAQIIYVNSSDAFTSYYYAIDNNLAAVISLSYGLCELQDEGSVTGDEAELTKGNSLGITIVNSTGDTGVAECDANGAKIAILGLGISYPASSPEVTGVGGTAIPLANFKGQYWGTANGPNGGTALSYIPEQAWNDDSEIAEFCVANPGNTFCTQGGTPAVSGWLPITNAQTAQADIGISSSGGGPSNCATTNGSGVCTGGFAQPSYQAALTISGQAKARFSPDVSLMASPNYPGYIFCTQLSELSISGSGSSCASGISNSVENDQSIIGGTSVSTPVFAGIVTLLNQYLSSPQGLGNINPNLYLLAATPSNGAFHPVTTADNIVYCTAGTPTKQPVALQCPAKGSFGFSASNADTTTGYNLVTGLGSVDVNNLAMAWAATLPVGITLTPTANSFLVAQGSSIDATVNVTFGGGFAGTVTFQCTDPVSESICTLPPQINATGPVSFHITTTPPTVANFRSSDHGTRIFYAALLPGLLGIVLTTGSRRRSLHAMRLLGLVVVMGFSTLWLASCGGSSSSAKDPGTPKGTYTITVTGTSGTTTATTTFQLVVQ